MITQEQSLEAFIKNIDEIISTRYVLSQLKISNLLKCIAQSKMLCELFAHCNDGFDFDETYANCFVMSKNLIDGKFILPSSSRDIIALGFIILFKIDTKEINFMKLLGDFFHKEELEDSYQYFCKTFLEPFKDEVLYALKAMITGSTEEPKTKAVRSVKNSLPEAQIRLVKDILTATKSLILQYKMDDSYKAELMLLYDNLVNSLYENDLERIKIAFLAYKYSTLFHRKNDSSVEKIEKILIDGGVLNAH